MKGIGIRRGYTDSSPKKIGHKKSAKAKESQPCSECSELRCCEVSLFEEHGLCVSSHRI